MSDQRYRGRPLPMRGQESPYASDRPQPVRVKPPLTRHPADVPVVMAGETESDPPLALEDDQPRQTLFPNGSVLATMTYVWDPVQEMPVPWDGRSGGGGGGTGDGVVDQGRPTTNANAWPVKIVSGGGGTVDQGAAGSQAWPVSLSGQPIAISGAINFASPQPVTLSGQPISVTAAQGTPAADTAPWPVKVVSGGSGGGGGGTVDQGAAGSTPWPVTIPTPVPVSGTVGVTQPVQVAPTSGQPLIVAATSPLSVTFPSAQAVTIPTPVPVSGTVGVSGNVPVVPVAGSPLSVTFPTAQAVTVGNFPATQPISGAVNATIVGNPGISLVGGSVVAAQGAAGADTAPWPVKLIPGTAQPISGTVSVSNLPTTQPVSGTVSITQPVQVSPTAGSPLSVTFPTAQSVTVSGYTAGPTQIAQLGYGPRAFAAVAAGNTNIVSPPAGFRIYVYRLLMTIGAGTVLAFLDDGGNTFSGNMTFANFTALVLGHEGGADPLFKTGINATFIITLGGSSPQAVGTIWYVVGT